MATVIEEEVTDEQIVDERLFEVVGGQLKEKVVGTRQNLIATQIAILVGGFDPRRKHGHAVTENLFVLDSTGDLQRRPDFAFVSRSRWSELPPDTNAWDVVPDWAVEVVSPSNTADGVVGKTAEYFQAGTRLVWVVYTQIRSIYAYTSPTELTIHQGSDEISAAPVLPDLKLSVSELFAGISDPV
ncbi:MAG: Uma2 family endonuclease [Planctomycetota bacterium]|nr:Uma2 family endonuclease [Planctomycetota bacterium]